MTLDTSSLPLFLEKHISRIPALQLLQNLGYVFLRPQDAHLERKGRLSNVLLEGILEQQLRRLNRIRYKGREREFSDANIQAAIEALRNAPLAGGPVAASRRVHDLLTMGKTLEQTIDGDTKSYTVNYLDWRRPERNLFHAVEEVEVQLPGSRDWRTLDIVLFVNGIPFAVIECRRPDEKDAIEGAIAQHLRNQRGDHIPRLFAYAQLLLALNQNEAAYATAGTTAECWSHWREGGIEEELARLANRPLTRQQKANLYAGRGYLREYFDELEMESRPATGQDAALYCLCRPERLIELSRQFIVFENGVKIIARHQQYFAVKKAIEQIKTTDEEGRRKGGVVWHTQGSGKSLTMAMLAKAIALDPEIHDPRLVIVSDRDDLDTQIRDATNRGGTAVAKAATGKHLLETLSQDRAAIISAAGDLLEAAGKIPGDRNESADIFVLADESHRSLLGEAIEHVRRVLPRACYIGFTGIPLKKQEKIAAETLGGIIDAYSIGEAVRDRAIVPLLYECRRLAPTSQAMPPDEERIRDIARDIGEHFSKNTAPPFKAILAAESKPAALKYKELFDEFGLVASDVLIAESDAREADEAIANALFNTDHPRLIIVVDQLFAGLDAPRNIALYLDKPLEDHGLLQAIARVNRVCEGKEFGYILDYSGALGELGEALNLPALLSDFDPDDLRASLTDISVVSANLPVHHAELWNLFKELGDREDAEAFERLLGRENIRERFYQTFSAYHRGMRVAFSSAGFFHHTASEVIERYKQDLRFFQRLRIRVKCRYADEMDFPEYETGLRKLIEAHVSPDETLRITPLTSIFDRENFGAEVEELGSVASKADTIVHRTRMTIARKMEEDPFFYRRLSKTLADAMEEWREERITDAVYLAKATEMMQAVRERGGQDRAGDELPPELQQHGAAQAFYGAVRAVFEKLNPPPPSMQKIAVEAALEIDRLIREHRVVDWLSNPDVQNEIRNRIDDYLYELKTRHAIVMHFDEMDAIVERALAIAKTRYA